MGCGASKTASEPVNAEVPTIKEQTLKKDVDGNSKPQPTNEKKHQEQEKHVYFDDTTIEVIDMSLTMIIEKEQEGSSEQDPIFEKGNGVKGTGALPRLEYLSQRFTEREDYLIDFNDKEFLEKGIRPCFEDILNIKDEDEETMIWIEIELSVLLLAMANYNATEENPFNGLLSISQEYAKAIEAKIGKTGNKGCEHIKDVTCRKDIQNGDFLTFAFPLRAPAEYMFYYWYACYTEKENYSEEMTSIAAGNNHVKFKWNHKSYGRLMQKLMTQETKEDQVELMWDVLRCAYQVKSNDVNDVLNIYNSLSSKFEIIRVKNKMNTHLKNITINYLWKGIMCEAQISWNLDHHQLAKSHLIYDYARLAESDPSFIAGTMSLKPIYRAYFSYVCRNEKVGLKVCSEPLEAYLFELAEQAAAIKEFSKRQ